eukprot:scaffold3342_cov174-Amphora_coffeaeformis.AAC.8
MTVALLVTAAPLRCYFLTHANEEGPGETLFNFHSEAAGGRAVDDMIECVEAKNQQGRGGSETSCGVITNMLEFIKYAIEGPSSVMLQPITVQNRLVGVVPNPILWTKERSSRTVFKTASLIQGTCTRRTTTTTRQLVLVPVKTLPDLTFFFFASVYRGEGDWHDSKFDEYRQSIQVTADSSIELFTENSPTYSLIFSQQCDGSHNTECGLYFAHFRFILHLRSVDATSVLSQGRTAQRKTLFHAVCQSRSTNPLNTVFLGLSLLQDEITKSLGKQAPEKYGKSQQLNQAATPDNLRSMKNPYPGLL